MYNFFGIWWNSRNTRETGEEKKYGADGEGRDRKQKRPFTTTWPTSLVLLVRPRDHARIHREQRRPRGGGHGGRFSSTRSRQRRDAVVARGRSVGGDAGRGGGGGAGGRVAHFAQSHFLLPLLPAVPGPVQIAVLVEHQADPGRVHPVGFPQRRGGVQLLLRHLEQHRTVAQRYGDTAHLRVLFINVHVYHTRFDFPRHAAAQRKRADIIITLKHSSFSIKSVTSPI